MGDAYRGLTIRIGAETNSFTQALSTMNRAIRTTQTELRTIQQGMKFDPKSFNLASANVKLYGERLQETTELLRRMKLEYDRLGSEKTKTTSESIKELAERTENAAMKAEDLRTSFNNVDKELEKLRRQFKDYLEISDSAWRKMDKREQDAWIELIREEGKALQDLFPKYDRLREEQKGINNELMDMDSVVAYEKLGYKVEKATAEVKDLSNTFVELSTSAERINRARGEFEQLQIALNKSEHTGKMLENEMRQLDESLKLDPSNMYAAVATMNNLKGQAENTEKRIEQLRLSIRDIQNSDSSVKKITGSTKELAEHVNETTERYREQKVALANAKNELNDLVKKQKDLASGRVVEKEKTDFKELASEIEKAKSKVKELQVAEKEAFNAATTAQNAKQIKEWQNEVHVLESRYQHLQGEIKGTNNAVNNSLYAWQSLGMTMYASVSPAFSTVLNRAMTATDEIDSAYRDMRKTVEGTEEQFERLKKAAIEASKYKAVSAEDILEIQALGGQLGIAVDELETFAEVVGNLSIATDLDAETAATELGQLANILNLGTEEMVSFGDALVRLGNNNAAQESSIMNITSRIASMSSNVGMSTDKILAWSTAIAATGQNSEAAGTAISNTISDINTAVASGGDKLAGFAEVANMSAEEFASAWKNDASSALEMFIQGLAGLDSTQVDVKLQQLGITAVRQKQALMNLTNTVNTLDDALEMSSDAWNGVADQWGEAGDAAREADAKAQGFSGSVAKLSHIADAFGYAVGESIAPALSLVVSALQQAESFFEALPAPIKMGTVAILALGAGAGVLLTSIVSVGAVINDFKRKSLENAAALRQLQAEEAKATGLTSRLGSSFLTTSLNIKTATAATRSFANAATDVVYGVKQIPAKLRESAVAAKVFTAAANVAKLAAVGLAFEGIMLLGEHIGKEIKNAENFSKATSGLGRAALNSRSSVEGVAKATAELNKAYSSTNKSAVVTISQLKDLKSRTDALAESQASLADKMTSSFDSIYANTAMAKTYRDEINNLTAAGTLNNEQQARLKVAVDGLNEALGTSIEITNAETGELSQNGQVIDNVANAIDGLIAAKEREARAEALMESTKDLYKQQLADSKALADATNTLTDAQEQLNNAISEQQRGFPHTAEEMAIYAQEVQNAQNEVDRLNGLFNATNDSLEAYSSQMTLAQMATEAGSDSLYAAIDSQQQFVQMLSASGLSVTDFAKQLADAGYSAEQFAKLNTEQLSQLASKYDGTFSSIEKLMGEFTKQSAYQGEAAGKAWSKGLSSNTATAVSAAANITSMTEQEFIDLADKLGVVGDEAVREFANEIRNGSSIAEASAKTVANSAKSGLSSVSAHGLGVDFANGYASGIISGQVAAKIAAIKLAKSAMEGVQQTQDSHSPAKETMKFGHDFDAGYEKGILKDIPVVKKAAESLGEAALGGIGSINTRELISKQARNISDAAKAASIAGYGAIQSFNIQANSHNYSGEIGGLADEIRDLKNSLGQIIANNAPVVVESERQFNRRVRNAGY